MDEFRHVLTLLSFVFGFALAHLLVRLRELLFARKRVTFSGLSVLAMIGAALLVYANWLSLWDFHQQKAWDLVTMSVVFAFSLSVCFVCMVAAPQTVLEGPVDMAETYWDHRKILYVSWAVCEGLAVVANSMFVDVPDAGKLLRESWTDLAMMPAILLALTVPKPWAQWTATIAIVVLNVVFLVLFESQLG